MDFNFFEEKQKNSSNLRIYTLEVDPDLARQFLKEKATNRKIVLSAVKTMAADMKAGRWVSDSDAIKFDLQGRLIDGQHRLEAIILSGTTLFITVIYGYPEQSMTVLDLGTSRTVAQIGQIKGIEMTERHTACLNALSLPHSREPFGSKVNKLHFFEIYQKGIRFAVDRPSGVNNFLAPSLGLIAKAFYYEFQKEKRQRLNEFINVYTTSFTVSSNAIEDSAAIALLNSIRITRDGGLSMTHEVRVDIYIRTHVALSRFLMRLPTEIIRKSARFTSQYPLPGIDPTSSENIPRFAEGDFDDVQRQMIV